MAKCDQRGTTRAEDWSRWWNAVLGEYLPDEKRRAKHPLVNYLLTAWHTFKNIWIEELRRWGIELNKKDCEES